MKIAEVYSKFADRELKDMSKMLQNRDINQFDELAQSLKPHPSQAQILIEARSDGITLEKALKILRTSGISELEHQIIRKGDPAWILLRLPTKHIREAVLILTEAGFIKLKGINPLNPEYGQNMAEKNS